MSVIITAEALEEIVNYTEPMDMSREIRKGDFVVLPRNSASYQAAHVEYLSEDRRSFRVTFGDKDTPSDWRIGRYFDGQMYTAADVSEIWRQRRVAKQHVWKYEGKDVLVKSSDLEWYCVYADERYKATVSWWAQ